MSAYRLSLSQAIIACLLILPGCSWFVSEPAPVEEITLALIKPDAVRSHHTGKIIDSIEHHGFTIIRMKKVQLTPTQAEKFYAAHKKKPFFKDLVEFMTSGPTVAMALEKEGAIANWRSLMGNTNPSKAAPGTIRRLFGTSITENAVHGSDSPEGAKVEIMFFFPDL